MLSLSLQPPRQKRSRRHNCRLALGSSRNHSNFNLQEIRNKPQIVDRRLRKLRAISHAVRSFIPARKRFVFRSDMLVFLRKRRHFLQGRALVVVSHANLNFPLRIKNVQLGDHHRIDPIDHFRVPQYLQVLRYAKMINGIDSMVITKLDVFDTQREIQVCVGYNYKGTPLKEMPALAEEYEHVTPEYKPLPGWNETTYGVRDGAKLPKAAIDYLRFISDFLQVEIGMISTGPEREATIVPAGTLLARWL